MATPAGVVTDVIASWPSGGLGWYTGDGERLGKRVPGRFRCGGNLVATPSRDTLKLLVRSFAEQLIDMSSPQVESHPPLRQKFMTLVYSRNA